jgi:hypothetical protein
MAAERDRGIPRADQAGRPSTVVAVDRTDALGAGGSQEQRRLPNEARAGLMRAWIEVLQARHPGVRWVPADNQGSGAIERPNGSSRAATGQSGYPTGTRPERAITQKQKEKPER